MSERTKTATYRKGNSGPPLRVYCESNEIDPATNQPKPADLTGATSITFKVTRQDGTVVPDLAGAADGDPTAGVAIADPTTLITVAGRHRLSVDVLKSGQLISYPNGSYLTLLVTE